MFRLATAREDPKSVLTDRHRAFRATAILRKRGLFARETGIAGQLVSGASDA